MIKRSTIIFLTVIVIGFLINFSLYAATTSFQVNGPVVDLCMGYNNPDQAPIVKMKLQGGAPIQSDAVNVEVRGNCMPNEEFEELASKKANKGEYLSELFTQSPAFYFNWLIWTALAGSLMVIGKKIYENTRR